jgi:uncharacterized damage-inducible protein DinB
MLSRALIRDLFEHMEWADARMWGAVLTTHGAYEDERLRAILAHLHNGQHAFLQAWKGEPPTFRRASEFPQPAGLYAYAISYYPLGREFLESADDTQLGEPLILPWAGLVEQHVGKPLAPTTLAETIVQLFSHTTHHRAQISSRIRAVGGEPPLVDYIGWVWFGRPQPEWPQAGAASVQ